MRFVFRSIRADQTFKENVNFTKSKQVEMAQPGKA